MLFLEAPTVVAEYSALSLPYAETQAVVLLALTAVSFLLPAIPWLHPFMAVLLYFRLLVVVLLAAPLLFPLNIARPIVAIALLDLALRMGSIGALMGVVSFFVGIVVVHLHTGAHALPDVPFPFEFVRTHVLSTENIIALFVLGTLTVLMERYRQERSLRRRLEQDIHQLTHANVLFQEYALSVEQKTAEDERKRITREIHDSAGHALTGLKMLLQAARNLIRRDPHRAEQFMEKGMAQIQVVLDEIRVTLRALRSTTPSKVLGLQNVVRIVEDFRAATGIHVAIHFTMTALSYGVEVDSALCRLVQESLTNSLRHGHADFVTIHLSSSSDTLRISVTDNGSGSEHIEPGIGMSGMRERISQLGGSLSFSSHEHGFNVEARIPLMDMRPERPISSASEVTQDDSRSAR